MKKSLNRLNRIFSPQYRYVLDKQKKKHKILIFSYLIGFNICFGCSKELSLTTYVLAVKEEIRLELH